MKIEFKNSIGGLIFFVPSNGDPNCLDKSQGIFTEVKNSMFNLVRKSSYAR